MSLAVNYMNPNAKNSRPGQMMGPPAMPLNSMPPNSMPNNIPQPHCSPTQIQKILDENNQLIQTLADCQSKGKHQDTFHLTSQLHRNLELMFRVTDNSNSIPSFLHPPTSFNQSAPTMSNGIHHPGAQQHLNAQQQQQQQQNAAGTKGGKCKLLNF